MTRYIWVSRRLLEGKAERILQPAAVRLCKNLAGAGTSGQLTETFYWKHLHDALASTVLDIILNSGNKDFSYRNDFH